MTVFCLRVDIDTGKGLKKGVPPLLTLLDKYNIPGSFYIPTGGESNILDILRYRGGPSFNQPHKEKLTFREKLRTVLTPKNFAKENSSILRNVIKNHELGVHGHKHRHWTRGLEELDVEKELRKMIDTYKSLFGDAPDTFASPGFRTDERVLQALDKHGFKAASDLPGQKPFHPEIDGNKARHVQVPITVREGSMPPIEAWRVKGLDDETIIERFTKEIEEKPLVSTYIHPSYEATKEQRILEKLLSLVEEKGCDAKTIGSLAADQ